LAACAAPILYYSTDISLILVEWLELLRELGFGKVTFYPYSLHANASKVLR